MGLHNDCKSFKSYFENCVKGGKLAKGEPLYMHHSVSFVLPKRSHLHRAYLVNGPTFFLLSVFCCDCNDSIVYKHLFLPTPPTLILTVANKHSSSCRNGPKFFMTSSLGLPGKTKKKVLRLLRRSASKYPEVIVNSNLNIQLFSL